MAAGNENNAWINGVKLMTAGFHWNVSQAGMFSALCLHNVLLYTGEKWQNQDMKERQLSETLQCPLGLCKIEALALTAGIHRKKHTK